MVLLTTWNRPALLRQSLPQVEREARALGAELVIADDQSSDSETLGLLERARQRGADVICRPGPGREQRVADAYVQHPPRVALARMLRSPLGAAVLRRCVDNGSDRNGLDEALLPVWQEALDDAHLNAQRNHVFGLRHVLDNYGSADWIFKVDDDVFLNDGALRRLLYVWDQATRTEGDVFAVSGLRTVHQLVVEERPTYAVTHGLCHATALYKARDWEAFLEHTPERLILRDGFDNAFTWWYAPRHRPHARTVTVTPSVAYHAGFNGLHVRNLDLNCDYEGRLDDVVVQ